MYMEIDVNLFKKVEGISAFGCQCIPARLKVVSNDELQGQISDTKQIMERRGQPERAEAEDTTCRTSTIPNFCNLRQCTVDFVFGVSFV